MEDIIQDRVIDTDAAFGPQTGREDFLKIRIIGTDDSFLPVLVIIPGGIIIQPIGYGRSIGTDTGIIKNGAERDINRYRKGIVNETIRCLARVQ